MKCGRGPGGSQVDALGSCPVPNRKKFDGINQGKNGGRFCWAIAGTMCQGEVEGSFAKKFSNCILCPFYQLVANEGGKFMLLTEDRV